MKHVFIVSVMLAFLVPVPAANALTVENVSVSDSGGIVVSGEASASGSSDASAEVRSTVRTEGSNTRVQVDIRTSEDGTAYATTALRVIRGTSPLETRDSTAEQQIEASTTAAASSSPPRLQKFFDQFRASIERIVKFLFFW